MEQSPTRQLAVLIHADIVESTALVRLDEVLAHQRIQDAFVRFSETIARCNGIAHEIRGDALVAEFSRSSDALEAALTFQELNESHNERLHDNVRPVMRVGIAMGEVVIADHKVTGDGIVLAQRIEQLAAPGCVCIQSAVYETIPRRLPFDYEDLGKRRLKGFSESIGVYRAHNQYTGLEFQTATRSNTVSDVSGAVSDKPSVVVLPFVNVSNNEEQNFFCVGLTDDVITELSRYRELVVTCLSTTNELDETHDDVIQASERVGAHYVLQGNVRKSGDRLRVTVQLSSGDTGVRIWAEKLDRSFTDVFEVQDDLSQSIATGVADQIEEAAHRDAVRKPITDLTAYGLVLRARGRWNDWAGKREDILQARELYQQALDKDPECSRAYAGLAENFLTERNSSWTEDRERAGLQAVAYAQKALAIDALDSNARGVLGNAYKYMDSSHDRARVELSKAIALNPNDYWNICAAGAICVVSGELDEAIEWANEGLRRNPLHKNNCLAIVALAKYLAQDYEAALESFVRIADTRGDIPAYVAASYAQLGRKREAQLAAANFEKRNADDVYIDSASEAKSWRNYWWNSWAARDLDKLEPLLEGLVRAGVVTSRDS